VAFVFGSKSEDVLLVSISFTESPRCPVDQVLRDPRMIAMIREMRQNRSPNARRIVEHTVTAGGLQRTFKLTLSCVDGHDSTIR